MKYLLNFALISVFLTGCADNPLKEASIEDRAAVSTVGKSEAVVVKGDDAASVSTTGITAPDISATKTNTDPMKTVNGVETHGVALQAPESKSLADAGDKTSGQNVAGGQAEGADALKFVAQPVLDPKDPQSPLAQRRILFDYDSAAIRDEYRTLLEMHAQYLKNEKSAKLILQGHADERGSREYNLALGQRRSESVYKAMNLLGVQDAQMEAVSLGEEKPVIEGHDENAWAQNRRTELLYQGE